jgi:hypothetical protein
MAKSLTPQTFYKILFSSLTLVALILVISTLSTNNNLVGYVVHEAVVKETNNLQEFVPCPLAYKDQACIRGSETQIEFSPIFSIFNVRDNILVGTTISWGNQPVCLYETISGFRYRLNGRILKGGPCQVAENGFLCER